MTAARPRAPTLAWLPTVLICLLAGMTIVESRRQRGTAVPDRPSFRGTSNQERPKRRRV